MEEKSKGNPCCHRDDDDDDDDAYFFIPEFNSLYI